MPANRRIWGNIAYLLPKTPKTRPWNLFCFTGGKLDYSRIATDAFGNALANNIGYSIGSSIAAGQQQAALDAARGLAIQAYGNNGLDGVGGDRPITSNTSNSAGFGSYGGGGYGSYGSGGTREYDFNDPNQDDFAASYRRQVERDIMGGADYDDDRYSGDGESDRLRISTSGAIARNALQDDLTAANNRISDLKQRLATARAEATGRAFNADVAASPAYNSLADAFPASGGSFLSSPEPFSVNAMMGQGTSFYDENGTLNINVITSSGSATEMGVFASSTPQPMSGSDALDVARQVGIDYYRDAQERAVQSGSFVGYVGAGLAGTVNRAAFFTASGLRDLAVNPSNGFIGAGKSVVNFGPELANAAVGGMKTVLDGYTQVAELLGVKAGTFDGFRATQGAQIDPLFAYSNDGQQLVSIGANVFGGGALAKYGNRYGFSIDDVGNNSAFGQHGAVGFRVGEIDPVSGQVRVSNQATFGNAISNQYRETFFAANPELKGRVVVHHAVEQQVLDRFPGVVTEAEIHSLENLRGIPLQINSDVHLSKIRVEMNRFYASFESRGAVPTKADLLQKATEIDAKYGIQFKPPVGGN